MQSVSGYEPQNGIEDLVWVAGQRRGEGDPASDKVIDLTTRRA